MSDIVSPMQRLLPRLDRGTLAIVLAWLLACVAWVRPMILTPDGAGYWSWLPSALLDGDLLLYDEWQALGMAPNGHFLHQWTTPTLHLSNHWGPGPAVAWAPGFLMADVASRATPGLEAFVRDGFRLPHVAAGVVIDALCTLAALLLARDMARRFVTDRIAVMASLGMFFGSPLLHYGVRGGLMAHAVAAFAATLAAWLSIRLRDGVTPERLMACGLACGFAACVRPQLLALLALPCLVVPVRQLLVPWRGAAALAAGTVIGVLPQWVVSQAVYGQPLGALTGGPGPAGRPHAAFERFWTWEPWLSAWHGVLPWTPFMAVGLVGLVLLVRVDSRLAAGAWVVVISQALAIAMLDRPFWGAHAFGQRRLDGLAGLLVVGAAIALARLPRALGLLLTLACGAWTTALFLAAWKRLPLNEPQSLSELAREALAAALDVTTWARPLADIPATSRGDTMLALVAAGIPVALLVLVMLRLPGRTRLGLAAAWVLACAAWLQVCGLRGASRLEPWREAALRHQALGELAGSTNARIGMLRLEAEWYRRRGDVQEAARVDARAADLERRLAEALSRVGLPSP